MGVPVVVVSLLVGAAVLVPAATPTEAEPADPGTAPTEPPGQPASVQGVPVGRTAIGLSWPQVDGAESYDLFARNILTGAVTGPIPAAGLSGEVAGLTLGRQYEPGVRARNDAGLSDITWGAAAYVLPNWAPAPVTDLHAFTSQSSTRLVVTWTSPGPFDGVQPDSYLVGVTTAEGILVGSYATCDHPCESRTVDGLEPGSYRVRVAPLSMSGGVGRWTWNAAPLTVVDGCDDGGACVAVDATSDDGPATLRAQGLNSGLWEVDMDLLRPLKLQNVRGATSWTYDTARALGARVTWVLSNAWFQYGMVNDDAVARPWDDWAHYRDWAAGTALALNRQRPVDYIDVQNEPYVSYFPDEPEVAYTPDLLATHVAVAREGLRTGDPTAKIVGPSFGGYTDLQLRTFLNFAVLWDFPLDALNWHELSPAGGSVDRVPSDLIEHVEHVRQMLAERPSLGQPELHVNEFASTSTARLAGWGAGFIAALEAADIDVGMRTCNDQDTCARAAELIDVDGTTTLAPYWVHRFYADQTGQRLTTTSTNGNVSAFSTRDGGTVRVLLGRHNTCLPEINPPCNHSALVTQPPYDVPVRITGLPAGSTQQVVVEAIPATIDGVPAPTPVGSEPMVVADDGALTVVLPAVADGEAWTVTATAVN